MYNCNFQPRKILKMLTIVHFPQSLNEIACHFHLESPLLIVHHLPHEICIQAKMYAYFKINPMLIMPSLEILLYHNQHCIFNFSYTNVHKYVCPNREIKFIKA